MQSICKTYKAQTTSIIVDLPDGSLYRIEILCDGYTEKELITKKNQ